MASHPEQQHHAFGMLFSIRDRETAKLMGWKETCQCLQKTWDWDGVSLSVRTKVLSIQLSFRSKHIHMRNWSSWKPTKNLWQIKKNKKCYSDSTSSTWHTIVTVSIYGKVVETHSERLSATILTWYKFYLLKNLKATAVTLVSYFHLFFSD